MPAITLEADVESEWTVEPFASPLSSSSTQVGRHHGYSEQIAHGVGVGPEAGRNKLTESCRDTATLLVQPDNRGRHSNAEQLKILISEQQAAFERLLAFSNETGGTPLQDKNSACARFAESLRACQAAVSWTSVVLEFVRP